LRRRAALSSPLTALQRARHMGPPRGRGRTDSAPPQHAQTRCSTGSKIGSAAQLHYPAAPPATQPPVQRCCRRRGGAVQQQCSTAAGAIRARRRWYHIPCSTAAAPHPSARPTSLRAPGPPQKPSVPIQVLKRYTAAGHRRKQLPSALLRAVSARHANGSPGTCPLLPAPPPEPGMLLRRLLLLLLLLPPPVTAAAAGDSS
jgi:hypothetical protein